MLWSARTFRSLIKPFRLFTPAFLLPAISSPPILSTRRSCFAQCRTGPLCWQSRISATRPGCAIACLLNPTWGTSLRRWRRSRSTARGGVCFGDCLCSQEHEIPAGIAQRKSAASKGAEVGGSSPSPRATARSSTAELSALNREMSSRVGFVPIAQLVEHSALNGEVAGPSPAGDSHATLPASSARPSSAARRRSGSDWRCGLARCRLLPRILPAIPRTAGT
jgi:hypothetical protein